MRRLQTSLAIVLLFTASCPATALACECSAQLPDSQAIVAAAAVFDGEVVSIVRDFDPGDSDFVLRLKWLLSITPDYGHDWRLVTLKVLQPLKGQLGKSVVIRTHGEDSDCFFKFEIRRQYKVFAQSWKGSLVVDNCTNSRQIAS